VRRRCIWGIALGKSAGSEKHDERVVVVSLLIGLCVLPSVAAARSGPQVRPNLAGGYTPQTTSWPWTTWITSPNGSCTASLIAPKRLLTASHCVFDNAGKLLPASQWKAYINRRNTTTLPGEYRGVTAVVSNPQFTGEKSADYDAAISIAFSG
jgi:hypothetical protein